jgi:serine/threonine protein kinase
MPDDGSKLKQICGTPPFMSPEMLHRTGYDSSTDVWSFGVTAYVLMLGHFPYQSADKSAVGVRKSITDGNQLPSFQPARPLNRFVVGSAATTFLKRLLFRETLGRYTPQKALEDDWLSVAVALGSEGAESLPSMLTSVRLAKRAGLFGTNKVARQSDKEAANTVQPSGGPKSRLNKVLADKQRKYHGTKFETISEDEDTKSTTTGSTVTFSTVYSDLAAPCARQTSLSGSDNSA